EFSLHAQMAGKGRLTRSTLLRCEHNDAHGQPHHFREASEPTPPSPSKHPTLKRPFGLDCTRALSLAADFRANLLTRAESATWRKMPLYIVTNAMHGVEKRKAWRQALISRRAE